MVFTDVLGLRGLEVIEAGRGIGLCVQPGVVRLSGLVLRILMVPVGDMAGAYDDSGRVSSAGGRKSEVSGLKAMPRFVA